MIEFKKKKDKLLLKYEPEDSNHNWVREALNEDNIVTIARTFSFTEDDLLDIAKWTDTPSYSEGEELPWIFVLGSDANDYFLIKARILGLKEDLLLSKKLSINRKTFIANRGISIFPKIDRLVNEQIVIGGEDRNSIPILEFETLLKNFPTTTELKHYANSRISLILREYLGSMTDAQKKLDNYLKKKKPLRLPSAMPSLYSYEVEKYEYIRQTIKEMLKSFNTFSEAEWQTLMLDIILLIFPKYIAVLKNVTIKDFYSQEGKITNRYIDLALVDARGNLDIIEIKKPFDNCILSSGKYRGNYTPKKELSGSLMQAEKYLFHLNKWGVKGERKINESHAKNLPQGLKIKVTNPKAMIILGRSKEFLSDQTFDFEIIRRKYANIMDILTYDDLLIRLSNIIDHFKKLDGKT